MNSLCPAGWLNEQSITKHWFQSVRTCPYSWATGRNYSTNKKVKKLQKLIKEVQKKKKQNRKKQRVYLYAEKHRMCTQKYEKVNIRDHLGSTIPLLTHAIEQIAAHKASLQHTPKREGPGPRKCYCCGNPGHIASQVQFLQIKRTH